ncbi:folliculin-interacting protein 1 isoform X2 [Hyposmocoma kahamanoa]|uniref:folliculin-interacting protein 1 isoform X2 n=1 Tax=Hyposmocoma kahamanoa TaxID=1477025 RepID=UPI000E6D61EC|nr:folliculin-interacting protein 1 isoform X2 [Hyposmocoma kahamanoa]
MKFRSYQITPEQVRLLLFKECDWRGRKLLFDSSTIDKVPASKNDKAIRQPDDAPCIVEVANGYSYVYKGPATDASVLGEMIFGAVAMNYKGVSLKIHIMEEPRRLMCAKVFCVPTSHRISRVDRKISEVNSTEDIRRYSTPLNVPALREEGVELSFTLDRGDSGFCGDQSSYGSVGSMCDYFSMFDIWDRNNNQEDFCFHSPPGRKLSTSSNGSWQRRTFQNMATKFELGRQSSNLLSVPTASSNVTSNDSQVFSSSSASGTSDSLTSSVFNVPQKKNKLGLALLITVSDSSEMDEVRRCVEHSPQLQALVCRLRLATLAAGAGNTFVSTLQHATVDAARWLSDLLYGPRVPSTWLLLSRSDGRRATRQADALLADLCSVLSVADTKHTNFFISTLLTHVLTYHLGWVTTVSPYDTPIPQKHGPDYPSASKRTYNALWAQLSDLCGSIGFPPRAARTIISGTTNAQFVNRLLVVLTYFMRSGDIRKSNFEFRDCVVKETKVISVNTPEMSGLRRVTTVNTFRDGIHGKTLNVPSVNTLVSDSSSSPTYSTLVASDTCSKRSATLASLGQKLSTGSNIAVSSKPMTSQLKRNPTMMLSPQGSSGSSLDSSASEEPEPEQKVVFVLGDDEKLIGLKNKSNGGKSVKRSSKVHNEPVNLEGDKQKTDDVCSKENCDQKSKNSGSPSKCCGQTLQHSKLIKHSGFKFEFDKYPQIVTNYMKSKNLEILDRHYIGKPGNLKLDNYQFDPMVVPPIPEEKCEICYKCQQMESMLQTPTNASEMEYMNDMPRQSEPQFAKVSIVNERDENREISPKTFVRKRKENTIVVNIKKQEESKPLSSGSPEMSRLEIRRAERAKERERELQVRQVLEFPMPNIRSAPERDKIQTGFDATLLGGVTDHYVPDLILQGTIASPQSWETELKRDLDLTSYLNKTLESPVQAVAIIGDTSTWEVRVVGRDCGTSGMSSLVGTMLDALPAMWKAKVPAHQCLLFLESKLREFCVLSKTLADMLMSTDLCDIATLTKSLNIGVNDVPLLLAVATTHTPQVAHRYGISYR